LGRARAALPLVVVPDRGSEANLEIVLKGSSQLILDFGSTGDIYKSLADRVQHQTKIPYILIDGRIVCAPALTMLERPPHGPL
jgi:hypothetical protein